MRSAVRSTRLVGSKERETILGRQVGARTIKAWAIMNAAKEEDDFGKIRCDYRGGLSIFSSRHLARAFHELHGYYKVVPVEIRAVSGRGGKARRNASWAWALIGDNGKIRDISGGPLDIYGSLNEARFECEINQKLDGDLYEVVPVEIRALLRNARSNPARSD